MSEVVCEKMRAYSAKLAPHFSQKKRKGRSPNSTSKFWTQHTHASLLCRVPVRVASLVLWSIPGTMNASISTILYSILTIWFWTFFRLTRKVHLEQDTMDSESSVKHIKNQFQSIKGIQRSSDTSLRKIGGSRLRFRHHDTVSIDLEGIPYIEEKRPEDNWTWINPLTNTTIDDPIGQSFPTKLTTYQDLLNINTMIAIPENLHIAFAGDSLTRYQYISLVYYLKYGKWIDPKEVPNMTQEKQHDTWRKFYNFTKSKLYPDEQCDCFRPEGHKMLLMTENRYYVSRKISCVRILCLKKPVHVMC